MKHFTTIILVALATFNVLAQEDIKRDDEKSKNRPSVCRNILIIGDSNGVREHGWVDQLQFIRKNDVFYNTSISGNTIGFNNGGRTERNTLVNIDRYMNKASKKLGSLDAIIIMLGTNDCKEIFANYLKKVPENMSELLSKIKEHPVYEKLKPQLFIVSPPPYAPDNMLAEKYHGGAERISYLYSKFKKIAKKEDCIFIDTYSQLEEIFSKLTLDGIHLTAEGQLIIASAIAKKLDDQFDK